MPDCEALLAMLLRATVFLSLAAVLAEGLTRLVRPASPAVRRRLWLVVLFHGLLLAPLPVQIPWLPSPVAGEGGRLRAQAPNQQAAPLTPGPSPETGEGSLVLPSPATTDVVPGEGGERSEPGEGSRLRAQAPKPQAVPLPPDPSPETGEGRLRLPSVAESLLAVWLAGLVAISLVGLARYLRFVRHAGRLAEAPAAWRAEWEELLRREGIARPIPLRLAEGLGPALCWLPRGYVLIVPGGVWAALAPAQRRAILRHELAHYERADLWKCLAVRALAAVHWFNPLAWHAARRYEEYTEWTCDDAAARALPSTTADYAHALLALGGAGSSAPGPSARGGRLYHRIRRLAAPSDRKDTAMKKTLLFALLLALLTAGAVHVELAAQEPDATASGLQPEPPVSGKPPAHAGGSPVSQTAESEPPTLLTAYGTVVDEAGKPVQGAKVYLREWSSLRLQADPFDRNPDDILATTETDAQGNYRFDKIPARPLPNPQTTVPWDVVIIAPQHALAWRHLPAAQVSRPMTFRLKSSMSIVVGIFNRKLTPVTGANARVCAIEYQGTGSRAAVTDCLDLEGSRLAPMAPANTAGQVQFDGLPADTRATIAISHDNFRTCRVTAFIPKQHIVQAVLDPPLPRLVGCVTDAGTSQRVAGARVIATSEGGTLGCLTDKEGKYLFREPWLPQCEVTLLPSEDGVYLGRTTVVEIAHDEWEVQLDLQAVRGETVTGRVIDDAGEGIPGVNVAWHDPPPRPGGLFTGSGATTDSNGQFRVLVAPGKSRLLITNPSIPGFTLGEFPRDSDRYREINVVPGETTEEVIFRLKRIESPGEAPPSERPAAVPQSPPASAPGAPAVSPQTNPNDGSLQPEPPPDPAHPLPVDLTAFGTVVDEAGQPIAGASIRAMARQGGFGGLPSAKTGEDGRFTLSGLPDVPLAITASQYQSPTGRRVSWSRTIHAEPGQTDLRIVIDPKADR